MNESLYALLNVLRINKRHFKVYLCEFRLSVSAEILIAEAARKLNVAVISRDHEKLLVDLGRLRQSIEFSLMHS